MCQIMDDSPFYSLYGRESTIINTRTNMPLYPTFYLRREGEFYGE